MNAPLAETEVRPVPPLVEILALMAESAAGSMELFALDFSDVVDPLQWFAENTGLLAAIGQDAVQDIISAPFRRGETEPLPNDYAVQLLRQWELADPRDAWRHTGEAPPPEWVRNSDIGAKSGSALRPYTTPQSTVDAFWHVVSQDDPAYLARWLTEHPLDASHLKQIWEAKCSTAAA